MALSDYIPFWPGSRVPVVSVVRLTGVISSGGSLRQGLSLAGVASRLEAAFGVKRAAAVALIINSPGGSPVQSDLIGRRVRELARETNKPVFAFCEDVAASGGYWLALAADEIFANENSIVGSIGVVSAGFGLNEAIDRLGIQRRLYATGDNKGMLDPFSPEDPKHVERLRSIQDQMHAAFKEWVRQRRGARIRGEEDELCSGAFWTGGQALEYGLIDGVGDMRSVMRDRFGDKVRFRVFSQRPSLLRRLRLFGRSQGGGIEGAILDAPDAALAAIAERWLWGRFGL